MVRTVDWSPCIFLANWIVGIVRSGGIAGGGEVPPPCLDSTAIMCFLDEAVEELFHSLIYIPEEENPGVEWYPPCGSIPPGKREQTEIESTLVPLGLAELLNLQVYYTEVACSIWTLWTSGGIEADIITGLAD